MKINCLKSIDICVEGDRKIVNKIRNVASISAGYNTDVGGLAKIYEASDIERVREKVEEEKKLIPGNFKIKLIVSSKVQEIFNFDLDEIFIDTICRESYNEILLFCLDFDYSKEFQNSSTYARKFLIADLRAQQ
jgi:hypothetical protein